MTEKEELLEAYRKEIHNIATATDPVEVEKAMCKARIYIGELKHNHKLSVKDIMDMYETVDIFSWKAERRMSEGI